MEILEGGIADVLLLVQLQSEEGFPPELGFVSEILQLLQRPDVFLHVGKTKPRRLAVRPCVVVISLRRLVHHLDLNEGLYFVSLGDFLVEFLQRKRLVFEVGGNDLGVVDHWKQLGF